MRLRPPHRRAALALALAVVAGGRAAADPIVLPTAALGVEASYDSNVYNGRGPDYVTRITPRFALHVHDPRVDLKLSYDLGLWFYAVGRAKNSVNPLARAAFEARLTRRVLLKIADEAVWAHDPGFLLRAGVVAPQTSIFDNIVDAEVDFQALRRLELAASYSYRHTQFGSPPPGSPPLFDGDEHDAAVAAGYLVTRLDEVRLSNRFSYFTADGLGLAITDAPALGWRHRFFPWFEARVDAGPLWYGVLDPGRSLTPENAAARSGTTWRGAALARFAFRDARITLGFTRDLVGGTGAASVLWANYFTARASWHPTRIVELSAGASVFANGLAPSSARLYDGVGADALVNVELAPGVHLGGFYAFRWQEALAPGVAAEPLPGITRHVAGLRLTAAWGEEARPPRPHHHE